METNDDEQPETRQEDVHEDPGEEKQKQPNQGDSRQKGGSKAAKRTSLRLDRLLSP